MKFTELLMFWHLNVNKREMPWKGEKDPYKIWLSEIILQQTRVEQGLGYYERLNNAYPDVHSLAAAKDEAVFKLWEGLGYYNRCKNLLYTARIISKELQGQFPQTFEGLVALKGIGPYTAAAIGSFAFNLPLAVVDGNVFRVLSRVFGIATAIDSTAGKQEFTALADQMLDKSSPGLYNQAIMDFGATVCKPFAPVCSSCPVQKVCAAFQNGIVNLLPVKEKALQKKKRWFYYFMLEQDGKMLVHKRVFKDIWENLFEFYLVEAPEQIRWDKEMVQQWLHEQLGITDAQLIYISPLSSQQLTHQLIKGQFIKVRLSSIPLSLSRYQWQALDQIHLLAFPKFINQHLEMESIQTDLFYS